MLEMKDLCFTAKSETGEVDILKNINLTIEDNKFVVITGPNGGGKTTLAKAVMGIIQPTSGQILWNGEDVTNLSITERAKLGISYGFQQPPRFKGMKVRDLLKIAAGQWLSQKECCDFLNKVGLCANDYVNRDVDASLSGGEVKRIEIATLLARDAGLRRTGGGHRPVELCQAHRDLHHAPRAEEAHHHDHIPSGAHHPPGGRDHPGGGR